MAWSEEDHEPAQDPEVYEPFGGGAPSTGPRRFSALLSLVDEAALEPPEVGNATDDDVGPVTAATEQPTTDEAAKEREPPVAGS